MNGGSQSVKKLLTVGAMSEPEFSTIEQLSEVFRTAKEQVIEEWQLQVGVLLAELHLDKATMTDHMPDVITEIIRDLRLQREGLISEDPDRGSPPAHGVQRCYDGLDVGEVVAEYNLLRGAFTTVAERHGLYVVGEAMRIINHRVDETVRSAVMAFAAEREALRLEQEAEHLAFMAHDLRTPLNAISLLCMEIVETLPPETRVDTADLFDILTRNVHRVEVMLTQVLEKNLQPSGAASAFRPERRHLELWPLVQRLILDMRSLADQHAVTLVNEIPRSLTVYADAGLLSQVYQNLLGNAFKYAAKGRVIVQAESSESGVTCTVRDDGAGIPMELLSNVFDKMVTDPEGDGTGLGLAIVKKIVEAHGGKVTAQSVVGAGATLTFTLPSQDEEPKKI